MPPVYDKARYRKELDARNSKIQSTVRRLSLDKTQQAARSITAAPAPPDIEKTLVLAPPEDDALRSLLFAVEGLRLGGEQYTAPSTVDVPGEWTYPDGGAPQKQSSEGPIILYVHGGGFIYGSPGTARRATRRLAKLCKAKVLAVQYRYATEQPFPGSLLDVFVAYLALLSPPEGSSHVAVPPHKLVLAGESSGLSLLMALVMLIRYLQRQASNGLPTIAFHGSSVPLALPACLAGMCGFFDITCGLPSWFQNSTWDSLGEKESTYTLEWKDQKLWPADPPRADVYCEKSAMTHPLVSAVTAEANMLEGLPPMWIACSADERNADANIFMAKAIAEQGGLVRFEMWQSLTHVWPTALPKLPHSARVLEHWAAFIGGIIGGEEMRSGARMVDFATMEARDVDLMECTALTRDDVLRMTGKARDARLVIARKNSGVKL